MVKRFDELLDGKEYARLYVELCKKGLIEVRREYALRLARAAFGDGEYIFAMSALRLIGPKVSEMIGDEERKRMCDIAGERVAELLSHRESEKNLGELEILGMFGINMERVLSDEGKRQPCKVTDIRFIARTK